MPPSDWEFEYNSITFGGNNEIGVLDVQGLSMPDVRNDTTDRTADHGAFDYSQFLSPRMLSIHGDISDESNFEDTVDILRGIFVPQGADLPLKYKLPGGVVRRINCKPTKVDFPVDRDYMLGYVDWNVQFIAQDPRIYADTASTLDIFANPGPTSGIASNAGKFETRPVLTLTGPGTTWTIKNTSDGNKFIKWNGALTAGQTAVIDLLDKTVLKLGVSDYGNFDSTSVWWVLLPGSNTIEVTVGSGSTAATKCTLDWRSAWI